MTWIDRDQGVPFSTVCSCGRGSYLDRRMLRNLSTDRPVKCRGCGEVVDVCLCPPVRELEAAS